MGMHRALTPWFFFSFVAATVHSRTKTRQNSPRQQVVGVLRELAVRDRLRKKDASDRSLGPIWSAANQGCKRGANRWRC